MDALAESGFIHLSSADVARIVGVDGDAGWHAFSNTWADLERDAFMGDGGRYRFRRHAIYRARGQDVHRLPDAPHYQKLVHNKLNGGVSRKFAPVTNDFGQSALLRCFISAFTRIFEHASRCVASPSWHIEMHQFRIVAEGDGRGLPTPEGMHRDGVDWVVTLLVDRENVSGGATALTDAHGNDIARIEMSSPLEAILMDDRRLMHGVSPITVLDLSRAAHRDVLVLTFVRS
ncbi:MULTISPECIES: 2OG-Fe dioxygenase family protein [unclassified Methylobacterium]|uniref:2OG-Fe dioxygenase family protein n=1 Tax=unclassified Methylobacterium TaxID=2615210 RepID=UPI0009DC25CE|nr:MULTISPECIES: 2OG-Fe dioxygenase family protein [unclassified Methylobacterium]